jgi:uncharacterized membrane protein YsdA (DUF1294 family)
MSPLLWIASIYAFMNIVTFAAYGLDKHRAERGTRRIRERAFTLAGTGGWLAGGGSGAGLLPA